ncbi:MAG: hypothetical protein M0Z31_11815 [Clostridia bacterium]|nr:hypothetical protein [Clostridia bacterium]
MTVLFILLIIALIWYEVPPLIQRKMWREIAVFSALLTNGILLVAAHKAGIPLPNPNTLISDIWSPLARALEVFLSN